MASFDVWDIVSASLTGLVHATAYDFEVIGTNSGGSATSSIANATTTAAAPNAPSSLTVEPVPDGTTTKLAASWTASAVDSSHDAEHLLRLGIGPRWFGGTGVGRDRGHLTGWGLVGGIWPKIGTDGLLAGPKALSLTYSFSCLRTFLSPHA